MDYTKTAQQTNSNPFANLNILYQFYCKLNQQKLKHKSFDDVTNKAETMDLHEFMTFCKDFQLIAKQHRTSRPTEKAQNNSPISKKSTANEVKSNNKHMFSQTKDTVQRYQLISQQSLKAADPDKNEFLSKDTNLYQTDVQTTTQLNRSIKPQQFLNQKRLAQIFKTQIVLPEATVIFDGFAAIVKKIAEEMYQSTIKPSAQEKKNKKRKSVDVPQSIAKETQPKEQRKDSLECLLQYLRLDSKQKILEQFRHINQMHGNKDHLVLMRSPIKKIELKHNPLGKYAGVQNFSHSRLVQSIKRPEKLINKTSQLPSIKPNNSSVQHVKRAQKGGQKENFQSFLTKHKNQIELINKNYESRAKVTFVPSSEQIETCPSDNTVKYSEIYGDKKNKKYSQRHKDKILGDAANKELGGLIDASELFSDDIFNKYLQINYSPSNRYENKRKFTQSGCSQYKS